MSLYATTNSDCYPFVCAFRFPKKDLASRSSEIVGFQFHHDDPIRRHIIRGETFILGPEDSCYDGLWEYVHSRNKGEWQVGWRVTFTMADSSRCSIWKAYEVSVWPCSEKKLIITRKVDCDWEWIGGPAAWPDTWPDSLNVPEMTLTSIIERPLYGEGDMYDP